MLTLHGSSGHHYRDPSDKLKILRRCGITAAILLVVALLGWFGYRWYQSLNDQPPMSVTYIHHESDKKAPQLYAQMKLKLGTVTTPVSYGQTGTITANSVNGAKCQVNLYFRGGTKADDKTMQPQTAGSDGVVTWTWYVNKKYPSGIWPFVVECRNPTGADKVEGKVTITDPNFDN